MPRIKKLSNQEVFDRVASHLIKQNKKSRESSIGPCVYRTPQGLSCAVGCLISEEDYDNRVEATVITPIYGSAVHPFGMTLTELKKELKRAELQDHTLKYSKDKMLLLGLLLRKAGVTTDNLVLLNELRMIHDFEEVRNWKKRLSVIAAKYHLSTDNVEGLEPVKVFDEI